MNRNVLFIKERVGQPVGVICLLAGVLALVMLPIGVARAASLPPGSLAVLEPTLHAPEMQAAWDHVERQLNLDPLLLLKDKDKVAGTLGEWQLSGEAIKASHLVAYRAAMERSGSILSGAWDAYYSFDYGGAIALLKQMNELISIPGDTSLRADLAFEMFILEGMVLRASEGKGHGAPFTRAAALAPDRDLPEERYSPETIMIYNRVRKEISNETWASLQVTGSPDDTAVIVDGKQRGTLAGTLPIPPGRHYVELTAPGYEPWYGVVDANRLAPINIRQDLVAAGPEGDHAGFFIGRLQAGDRGYLAQLVTRLDVDYVLIPEAEENTLKIWLFDRDGRTVGHDAIWEQGDRPEEGMKLAAALVEPLRQSWGSQSGQYNVSLPDAGPVPENRRKESPIMSGWRKYAVLLGAALVIGSMSSASGGGGTRVEVTW